MKALRRWILLVALLAISGWGCLRILSENAPAAISKPSDSARRGVIGISDRTTAVQHARAVTAPPRKQDWVAQFHAARSSYFEFVTLATRVAYEGDGAAQYYIGRALARCEETNALYEDAENADEAVSHLAYSPALLEVEREEYLNCRRFRNEDPFKSLPARQGGYPASYWQSRAVTSQYPVAVVADALDSADSFTPQMVASALATGNPQAMLHFGWTRAGALQTSESASIMAVAWVLAACRGGANCSSTNDVLQLSICNADVEPGCAERYTAVDELRARFASEDFERANVLARDIQASLQYRDPDQLKKYLPF